MILLDGSNFQHPLQKNATRSLVNPHYISSHRSLCVCVRESSINTKYKIFRKNPVHMKYVYALLFIITKKTKQVPFSKMSLVLIFAFSPPQPPQLNTQPDKLNNYCNITQRRESKKTKRSQV